MWPVAALNSFSKSEIFFFYSSKIKSLGSIFLIGILLIYDALAAYCKVDKFSSKNRSDGERHAIINVYEFPPRDCFSKDVNFDSL